MCQITSLRSLKLQKNIEIQKQSLKLLLMVHEKEESGSNENIRLYSGRVMYTQHTGGS